MPELRSSFLRDMSIPRGQPCVVRILIVGVHYATAPRRLLERVAVSSHDLARALLHLKAHVPESFVLSTCNRTEVYAAIEADASDDALHAFLAEWSGAPPHDLRRAVRVREYTGAVEHALRVTAGLDSMVLGEDQIQAQMKRALAAARDVGALGPTLERLGAAALTCGKRVRTLTGVGRHSVSLESLAVREAAQRHGDLRAASILLIGAGEAAASIARHLAHAAARMVTVISRSRERSASVAAPAGFATGALSELGEALTHTDVVFTCTSAPHPVVTTEWLAHRLALREGAPLLCVDLGVPRDVDDAVASLPGVTVVGLDDLSGVAAAHRAQRASEVPAAEAIVTAETSRFLAWLRARTARFEGTEATRRIPQAAHG